jgi:hypothetical protein
MLETGVFGVQHVACFSQICHSTLLKLKNKDYRWCIVQALRIKLHSYLYIESKFQQSALVTTRSTSTEERNYIALAHTLQQPQQDGESDIQPQRRRPTPNMPFETSRSTNRDQSPTRARYGGNSRPSYVMESGITINRFSFLTRRWTSQKLLLARGCSSFMVHVLLYVLSSVLESKKRDAEKRLTVAFALG